jgi:hypothetical protein
MTNRYIQNGRVAVLTNPTHGWYTKHLNEQLIFDVDIVQSVLDGHGPHGLEVDWVMPGDRFCIETVNAQEVVTVLIIGSIPITGAWMKVDNKHWLTA